MDINLDYSDDENPITLKSDFILSLCDLIIGGKEGLSLLKDDHRPLYQTGVPGIPAEPMPGKYADLRRSLRAAFETV